MQLHKLLATAAILAPLLAPRPAICGPKEDAAKHIEAATKAHSEDKFDVALVELEAAYKLDPDPELLYAIGQVHSKLGQCDKASTYYEQYRKASKDPNVKAVIDEAVASCKPTEPPPAPEPTNPDAGGTTAPSGPDGATNPNAGPPPEGTSNIRAKLPYIVAGSGLLVSLIGFAVYMDARSELDAAESASTLPEYDEHLDSARSKRTFSVVLVGGGLVAIGAGVFLYMRDRDAERSRGVSVTPTTDGGMVTWSGSF